jgi:hypothetical protein
LVNGDIISNLTNFGSSIPYADLGFGYTYGILGTISLVNNVTQSPPWGTSNVPIYGNGTFYIYAYFDTNMAGDINGNGPFFEWVSNAFLKLNGDEYGSLGPFTCNIANNYTVYITPETPIDMMSGANIGENFTLSQLKNGQPNANGFYQTDVTSNTIVGFWFGVTNETYSQQFEIYTTAPAYIAPIPTPTPSPTATSLTRTPMVTSSPSPTSMPSSTSTPTATTSPVPSRPLTSTLTPTLFFVTLTVTDCVFAAVMISAAHIFAQKRLRDRQVWERTQK